MPYNCNHISAPSQNLMIMKGTILMKIYRFEEHPPYRQELGNGLVLKTAANEADIERVAACDGIVHRDEGIGKMCRRLFMYHPSTRPDDLIFVEDEGTGEVVSSLCLIPWQWRYDNVILEAGEMGIVGTLEPYRRRGLIRAQTNYFKELLMERGFDLSHIQGIPYFYRQFGYEYTIPLIGGYRIEMHQIPDPGKDIKPCFTCRPEVTADLPILRRLYDEAAQDLTIHACRDDEIWQYLSEYTSDAETAYEGWSVEDANGKVVGYFRIQEHGFGEGVTVYEVSRLNYDAALAILRYLKKLANIRKKPYIRLQLPDNCVLMQTARYHGAHDLGSYAWQIHIPDMARFLRKIGPALERRLTESPFSGLIEEIRINFYRETIALNFKNGKLTQVQKLGSAGGPIRVPPRAAVPLMLGYRSCEELRESWPDLGMPSREAYLMDTLFPKMVSYLYTIY